VNVSGGGCGTELGGLFDGNVVPASLVDDDPLQPTSPTANRIATVVRRLHTFITSMPTSVPSAEPGSERHDH
jgi:hypothetical protein